MPSTTTQIVEANGTVCLLPPPARKRVRHNNPKQVPIFIVMDAAKAGQIPNDTKFFLSLQDAADDLHHSGDEDQKPRAMMIWGCGDYNNNNQNHKD